MCISLEKNTWKIIFGQGKLSRPFSGHPVLARTGRSHFLFKGSTSKFH